MSYEARFKGKPPPVFREFAIAICELLLEHEWPADVTQAVTDVLAAVLSDDKSTIAHAANAAYAAAYTANAAARAAEAAYAAADVAYAAYAAARAAHATYAAARAASHAAYAAARAAVATKLATPAQANRIDTFVLMLT